jgi:Tfp pilus assembly protein PilO
MSADKTLTGNPGLRRWLITILAGGVAAAYALLVFVPGQRSIASMRKQIRDRQMQINRSETLVQPIRELEQQVATAQQMTAAWQRRAPDARHPAPLFAEVIRHANEAGAEVMNFAPQPEQPLETIGRIPVAMQAEGSYRSLHQLLTQLEGMRGLVWIDEVHFQPREKGGDRLSCTLKLIIFADRGEISG